MLNCSQLDHQQDPLPLVVAAGVFEVLHQVLEVLCVCAGAVEFGILKGSPQLLRDPQDWAQEDQEEEEHAGEDTEDDWRKEETGGVFILGR